MPFDPNHPLPGDALDAGFIRTQMTALNGDIQQRPTAAQLAAQISSTSANSNNVDLLAMTVSEPMSQAEGQVLVDKVNELITALRR